MEAAIPKVPVESVVDKKGDSNSGMLCDSDCWNHSDSKTPKQSISKRIRRICSDVKQTIFFWIAYLSFTLVEPILCARSPKVSTELFLNFNFIFASNITMFIRIGGLLSFSNCSVSR